VEIIAMNGAEMRTRKDFFDVSKEPIVFEGAFVPDPTSKTSSAGRPPGRIQRSGYRLQ
jgi:hypothetical protein